MQQRRQNDRERFGERAGSNRASSNRGEGRDRSFGKGEKSSRGEKGNREGNRTRDRQERGSGERRFNRSDRPYGDRTRSERPRGEYSRGEHSRREHSGGERSYSDRPRFERPSRGREQSDAADENQGQYYSVGRRAALELLKDEEGRDRIEKLYLAHGAQGPQIGDILHLARKLKVPMSELDRGKFRELEQRARADADAQGVIVLLAQRKYEELEDILAESSGNVLLIAIDGVEDPHNIGAIIRSAEAAGARALLLPKRGAALTPAVFKTSAGAAAHLSIVKIGNLEQTIRKMREEYGVRVLGLAGEGERTIYESDLTGAVCLVTGSEEKGIGRLVRERCDELVKIPMLGKTASLNASVATAVTLFEAVRQRQAQGIAVTAVEE